MRLPAWGMGALTHWGAAIDELWQQDAIDDKRRERLLDSLSRAVTTNNRRLFDYVRTEVIAIERRAYREAKKWTKDRLMQR